MQKLAEGSLDRQRRWFGEDVCDLSGPTFVEGGAAGDSVSFGPIATGLECFVEEVSDGSAETVIGGETFVASHVIKLKRTSVTLAITPRHKLKVLARGGVPERTFEKPVRTDGSFSPLVILKASLVKQGYR